MSLWQEKSGASECAVFGVVFSRQNRIVSAVRFFALTGNYFCFVWLFETAPVAEGIPVNDPCCSRTPRNTVLLSQLIQNDCPALA
jgi:hypothetical protein